MNLIFELNTKAMECSNVEYRATMKAAANSIIRANDTFIVETSDEALQALNGAWANGARILKNMPPEGAPAPLAGSPEPARLAA